VSAVSEDDLGTVQVGVLDPLRRSMARKSTHRTTTSWTTSIHTKKRTIFSEVQGIRKEVSEAAQESPAAGLSDYCFWPLVLAWWRSGSDESMVLGSIRRAFGREVEEEMGLWEKVVLDLGTRSRSSGQIGAAFWRQRAGGNRPTGWRLG